MQINKTIATRLSVFFAGIVLLVGCDATLTPFGNETGFYSVYGYLATSSDTHTIRIQDLSEPLTTENSRTLDVTVRLKNLATGRTETLMDSVVQFKGLYTHNFRTRLDVTPETRYRLTVEGPNGKSTEATATTPNVTKTDLDPAQGAQCTGTVGVRFPRISRTSLVELQLGMKYSGKVQFERVEVKDPVGPGVAYGFIPAVLTEEFVPEAKRVWTRPTKCNPEHYCRFLDDRKIRIAYTHFGPDRRADSTRESVFTSNVKNGIGSFVGLRRDTLIARLDTKLRCPGPETVPCVPLDSLDHIPRPPQVCPDIGDLP
ncbi:MAG: hypothetical protein ABEK84_07780 [Salinibacter sp.]